MENKQTVYLNVSEKEEPTNRICPHCRKEIDALARKCPYCQSRVYPKGHFGNLALKTVLGFFIVIIGVPILIGVLGALSHSSSSNTSPSTPSTSVVINPPVKNIQQKTQTAIPLSQAIRNYSDNSNYSFSDGSGSDVDVIGTIKTLVPIQNGSVIQAFGNTVIVTDGIYSAAVHQINDADFQKLVVGEKVEIKGGYMQSPENNGVQIVNVASVQEYQ